MSFFLVGVLSNHVRMLSQEVKDVTEMRYIGSVYAPCDHRGRNIGTIACTRGCVCDCDVTALPCVRRVSLHSSEVCFALLHPPLLSLSYPPLLSLSYPPFSHSLTLLFSLDLSSLPVSYPLHSSLFSLTLFSLTLLPSSLFNILSHPLSSLSSSSLSYPLFSLPSCSN